MRSLTFIALLLVFGLAGVGGPAVAQDRLAMMGSGMMGRGMMGPGMMVRPPEQLAFESGLHRTYISGIERGARNPTVMILARIAETLGVEVAELVEGAR